MVQSMSDERTIVPFLDHLQGTICSVAPLVADKPDAALSLEVARGLLDHMKVQHGVARQLRRDGLASMKSLLPALRDLLSGAELAPVLAETATLCAAGDESDFERLRELCGPIQRGLIALATPEALTLARAVLNIEADYVRRFSAALRDQNAVTAGTTRTVSAARNSRNIDNAALTAFIRNACPDETDVIVTGSSVIAGGYSKFTAGISLANTRRLPTEIIMRGDAAATFGGISVTDEYRVIRIAHKHGVRVPEPYAVDAAGTLLGTPFMLVEKKPGIVIGNTMDPPTLKSPALNAAYAAALASVHRVPLSALGNQVRGADCRSSEWAVGWIDEAVGAFRPLGLPSIAWETAFEWLRRNASVYDSGPRGLVHGDYGVNNALSDGDSVTCILDWEFVHIGNTSYDLGYFHPAAVALGTWQQFLDAYANAGGPLGDEKQLNYSVLLAATRIGVMLCQTQETLYSGTDTGLASAMTIARDYYGLAETRVADALNRVL
jgi:aminoglycoside phosphotransferase (APT) family kinase protein